MQWTMIDNAGRLMIVSKKWQWRLFENLARHLPPRKFTILANIYNFESYVLKLLLREQQIVQRRPPRQKGNTLSFLYLFEWGHWSAQAWLYLWYNRLFDGKSWHTYVCTKWEMETLWEISKEWKSIVKDWR